MLTASKLPSANQKMTPPHRAHTTMAKEEANPDPKFWGKLDVSQNFILENSAFRVHVLKYLLNPDNLPYRDAFQTFSFDIFL